MLRNSTSVGKFYSKSTKLINMSKIGKKILTIPSGVEISNNETHVITKGPKGELISLLPRGFKVNIAEGKLTIIPPEKIDHLKRALWGTTTSLIENNIIGVSTGFSKNLEIEGIGYKAEVQGKKLVLNIGYSHQVFLDIPEDLQVNIEKNVITISGINKQNVGDFAAFVRKQRKTNPYSGKGIKYQGERIIRKTGKKVASAAGS